MALPPAQNTTTFPFLPRVLICLTYSGMRSFSLLRLSSCRRSLSSLRLRLTPRPNAAIASA